MTKRPIKTEPALEPVRYTGEIQPDRAYYDGRLPHAIGVHNIQAFRVQGRQVAPGATFEVEV